MDRALSVRPPPRPDSVAWATIPLIVKGRTIGVFGLSFTSTSPARFDEKEIEFLKEWPGSARRRSTARASTRPSAPGTSLPSCSTRRLFLTRATPRRRTELFARTRGAGHNLRAPLQGASSSERRTLLAEASAQIAESLDWATIERVVELAVPRLADYCTSPPTKEETSARSGRHLAQAQGGHVCGGGPPLALRSG